MENKRPIDEWEYWDREISREELEKVVEEGNAMLEYPRVLRYRIRQVLWNKRVKRHRFRSSS